MNNVQMSIIVKLKIIDHQGGTKSKALSDRNRFNHEMETTDVLRGLCENLWICCKEDCWQRSACLR
jgi:hypothetical protein